jgi:copper homeostasis protein
MNPCLLEVIACSVDDAVAAERGGAHRLEVISRFDVGGLTPPLAMVREIARSVKLPLRVMLRETEDFCVTDEAERERLCATARELGALKVDGIVCGFLKDGRIDHDLLRLVMNAAPHTHITFHRAFEELTDPFAAIQELKAYPQVDRILTSGGAGRPSESSDAFAAQQRAAEPEITILAGGGIEVADIAELRTRAGIREFHAGRAARAGHSIEGPVEASRVRKLLAACS